MKKAAETSEFHALNPGAGAGNSRLLLEISFSHTGLNVTEIPRAALTYLSSVLRGFGVYGAPACSTRKAARAMRAS